MNLHDLNYFIRQNYPRELLFWLFTDTVELIKPRRIGFHYDPPNDYGCAREDPKQRCFREWVEIAVITGLTVEAKTIQLKMDDKITTKEYSRFCFDRVLAEQGERAMDPHRLHTLKTRYLDIGLTRSPQCNEPWSPGARGREGESDTLLFYFGPFTFKILTRSTNSIYQFLGQLLRQRFTRPRLRRRKGGLSSAPWTRPRQSERQSCARCRPWFCGLLEHQGFAFPGRMLSDLRSAAEVHRIAEQVNAIGRMDAVIHNAGKPRLYTRRP